MEYSDKIQDFLKPRKGKIKQGYYMPENKEKYIGDISKIIYRSNWEKRFLHFCDFNSSVYRYNSEPFSIKPLNKNIDYSVLLNYNNWDILPHVIDEN